MSNSTIKYKRVFTTNGGSGGGGGGTVMSVNSGTDITVDNTDPANPVVNFTGTYQDPITVVANYSALPAVGTVTGEFYWCSASQGTSWLPGNLGGTYYSAGLYYSNGATWEFMDVPYQATQSEVNTGTNTDKFVTPATLTSWTGRALTVGTTGINSGTTTRILYDNAGVLGEYALTGTGTVVAMQTSPSFLTSISTTAVTATIATQDTLQTIANNSSGTPATNYGSKLLFNLKSSTTNDQNAGSLQFYWATATHASRASSFGISLVNNASALTEVISVIPDGTGDYALQVKSPGGAPIFRLRNSSAVLSTYEVAGSDVYLSNSSAGNIYFRPTSATSMVRMNTTGVFIGTAVAAPSACLHVRKTTEQVRIEYDASNYYSTTVGSTGGVTFNAVGSGSKFTFSDNIELTQTVTTEVVVSDTTVTIVINGTTYKLLARA